MEKKFKDLFDEIGKQLFILNQQAIEEDDEEAKSISCYLIEILDSNGLSKNYSKSTDWFVYCPTCNKEDGKETHVKKVTVVNGTVIFNLDCGHRIVNNFRFP